VLNAFGENAAELAHRFLMAIIADAREVARKVEAHSLALVQAAIFGIQPFVEEADVNAEDPRDLEQPAGRDAIDAALILVSLLVGHAYHLRQLLLGQAKHGAAFANALADILFDGLDVCRDSFHSISPFQLGVAPNGDFTVSRLILWS
jgi:hypothetical protein